MVQRISALEPEMLALDDAEFPRRTEAFRRRLADGARLDDLAARGLRPRARGGAPAPRRAAVRRADDGRGGAAPGTDRRDEDRRGQDPRQRARRVPELPHRAGRARDHGERLPRRARRRRGWAPVYRLLGVSVGVILSQMDNARRKDSYAPRHHLRHQQRVRVRLPARQHVLQPRGEGPARPRLRHRRRDRQHPHRRGAHAPDHLGVRRGRHGTLRGGQQGGAVAHGVREGSRHGRLPRGAGRATSRSTRRGSGSPSPTRA